MNKDFLKEINQELWEGACGERGFNYGQCLGFSELSDIIETATSRTNLLGRVKDLKQSIEASLEVAIDNEDYQMYLGELDAIKQFRRELRNASNSTTK